MSSMIRLLTRAGLNAAVVSVPPEVDVRDSDDAVVA